VKVPNPHDPGESLYERYLYVPVDEYIADRESYDSIGPTLSTIEEEEWVPIETETLSSQGFADSDDSARVSEDTLHLKRRLLVGSFKDLASPSHKDLSDVLVHSIVSRIQEGSNQIIPFDSGIPKPDLESSESPSDSLNSEGMGRWAGTIDGVHAFVTGTIDHLFVSSTESTVKGKGRTTYAITEVTVQLIDGGSGQLRQEWEKRNSLFDSKGEGEFSEEKARLKAIDLIAAEITRDIIMEMKEIDWYATVARVKGNRVFISAGRLSGVRIGDTFSVHAPTSATGSKGEIRVADLFGIDASVADVTKGSGFEANDLVRPVLR
jgi:hypothetical protein